MEVSAMTRKHEITETGLQQQQQQPSINCILELPDEEDRISLSEITIQIDDEVQTLYVGPVEIFPEDLTGGKTRNSGGKRSPSCLKQELDSTNASDSGIENCVDEVSELIKVEDNLVKSEVKKRKGGKRSKFEIIEPERSVLTLYACEDCSTTFSRESSLNSHRQLFHGPKALIKKRQRKIRETAEETAAEEGGEEKKLECPQCDMTFKMDVWFKRHLAKAHQIDEERPESAKPPAETKEGRIKEEYEISATKTLTLKIKKRANNGKNPKGRKSLKTYTTGKRIPELPTEESNSSTSEDATKDNEEVAAKDPLKSEVIDLNLDFDETDMSRFVAAAEDDEDDTPYLVDVIDDEDEEDRETEEILPDAPTRPKRYTKCSPEFVGIKSPPHEEVDRKSVVKKQKQISILEQMSGNSAVVTLPLMEANVEKKDVDGDAKRFSCTICGAAFSRRYSLGPHMMRVHTKEKSKSCPICGRTFTATGDLTRHVRTHTGVKPFKCNHPGCNFSFASSGDLYKHTRRHRQHVEPIPKPHVCNVCSRAFDRSYDLKRHMARHRLSDPNFKGYECDICHRKFSRKDEFKSHNFRHMGFKPHKCHVCGKPFSDASNCAKHVKVHGPLTFGNVGNPLTCPLCNVGFKNKTAVSRHLATCSTRLGAVQSVPQPEIASTYM